MHPKQKMNVLIDRLNDAAELGSEVTLTVDEVKLLADEIGDLHYIPLLSNEQLIQLCNEGKIGQPISKES